MACTEYYDVSLFKVSDMRAVSEEVLPERENRNICENRLGHDRQGTVGIILCLFEYQ